MTKKSKKAWNFQPNQLLLYADSGLEFIALNRPDAKDRRGRGIGKAPLAGGWRRATPLTTEQALELMRDEGHNVGIRLRDVDLVIDVDPRNFKEGKDPLIQLQEDLGVDFSSAPQVITGSGGRHIYLSKPAEAAVRDTLDAYPGIEFKSVGRQVVAAGSVHPDAGKPYLVDELGERLKDRPSAPASLLEVIKPEPGTADAEAGKYSPEQLEEALDILDATADFGKGKHERWLQLMMAAHHATDGHGRAEFLAWCATDPEYAGQTADVGRRWDSLRSGRDRAVTYRHLFGLLVKHGGEAGKNFVRAVDRVPAEQDFPDYMADPSSKEDLDQVIASLPDGSPDVSEALEWFNRAGFCAVLEENKFRVMRLTEDPEWANPDGSFRHKWASYQRTDFTDYYATKKVQSEDGKKVRHLAQEWLSYQKRNSYGGVVFDPSGRTLKNKKGDRLLNLWTGWSVQPKKGDWSLLRQLLREGLCDDNEEAYEYCLNWAAYMVQHPERPAEVALVFKGSKGIGKSTWANALSRLCGKHSIQVSDQKHLTGAFNAHLRDCILLVVDEGLWAGDKRGEGVLKSILTGGKLFIEAKGKDAIEVANRLHVIFTSNEAWVVPASVEDERRFAVFAASAKFAGNTKFFDALNKQLDEGGLSALLWELKTRDISKFHPRKGVPKTGALAQQKIASMDYLDQWWYNCLVHRSLGKDIHPVEGDWHTGKARYMSHDIQASVELYLQKAGDRNRMRRSVMTSVGERIKRRVPSAVHVRFMAPKERHLELGEWLNKDGRTYGYDLPSSDDCRYALEAQIGEALPWEGDAVDIDETPSAVAKEVDEFDPLA